MEHEKRQWGHYIVLDDNPDDGTKTKKLIVYPGKKLSLQRHHFRSELWLVEKGHATVFTRNSDGETIKRGEYKPHDILHIDVHEWHQLANFTSSDVVIIEIQYGEDCREDDIERTE